MHATLDEAYHTVQLSWKSHRQVSAGKLEEHTTGSQSEKKDNIFQIHYSL